ncbi:MAG TPA: BON domain-containing protein [Steroidobacteraceae bacterium]|jgi:osmotically-inducible protein OsmY|nr:BON domain-containing protein [Steroidobacteraceae bacterium]
MTLRNGMAIAVAAALGLGLGSSLGAHAQNAPSSDDSRQAVQDRGGDMAERVRQALHSDPALYDKHIDVSMEKGKVVMKGFVDSAGDLQKAIRAANKAAGPKKVVNELTIKRTEDPNEKR